MKKIISTVAALMIMGSIAFAQDAKTTSKMSKETKTETKTDNSGKHLKKDGTPDKRYKENKTTKTTKTTTTDNKMSK